jgi:two-component system response regulator AtoC
MEVAPAAGGRSRVRSETAGRLLVVDDDPSVRDLIGSFAAKLGYEVASAESGEDALELFRARRPDLVTLDIVLPGIDGVETLKALKAIDAAVPVVMLSGYGQTRTIVDAVRQGAADFLRKPFEPEELELALNKALQKRQLEREVALLRTRANGTPESSTPFLFGDTRRMREIEEVMEHVADTDITVLIRGESGTGKELVARTLFQKSGRSGAPFVKVNCAALPAELLESELFGFEKGAFTGAARRKLGKFEAAHGGTIFLDEISEMHPSLQAKLLQVLQDGRFSRLGGEGDVQVDARVLAATNRNLEAAVRAGEFREDLFYRLNVVTIQIPPLRERTDEIPILTEHFLRLYSREYGRDYNPPSEAVQEAFRRYHWPGNVRELENLVKRMVVLGSEQPVLLEIAARSEQLPAAPVAGPAVPELDLFLRGESDCVNLKRIARVAAASAEKRVIERVLQRTRWNRKEAAEILQISYKALLYKMKEAGLAGA